MQNNLHPIFQETLARFAPVLFERTCPNCGSAPTVNCNNSDCGGEELICAYCTKPRDTLEGWHDCPGAKDAQARMEAKLEAIKRIASGDSRAYSEPWSRDRADRIKSMQTQLDVQGVKKKDLYDGSRD